MRLFRSWYPTASRATPLRFTALRAFEASEKNLKKSSGLLTPSIGEDMAVSSSAQAI